MSANPERPVLDAIGELVDWQLEEGLRRGDGPDDDIEMSEADWARASEAFIQMAAVVPQLLDGLAEALTQLCKVADTLPKLLAGISCSANIETELP